MNGGACANKVRVNRESLEGYILNPIRADLRDPQRVKAMAASMERDFAAQMARAESRAVAAPKELQELDARLERLKGGVADLEPDELAAAIARIEAKRAELKAAQPQERARARILTILPKAAAAYLKQVDEFCAGNTKATPRVRAQLKSMIGPITLSPGEDGSLWAMHRRLDFAALVRTHVVGVTGFEPATPTSRT